MAKSFRAAGYRILRDETSAAAGVTRLLAPRTAARVIESDADEWSLRLSALASIGQWDAVAIVAERPAVMVRTRNVDARDLLGDEISAAMREAAAVENAVQLVAGVQLEDGRVADGVLVAPLRAVHGVAGSLVALRVGRAFGAGDAQSAAIASDLAALEVFRSASALQDARAMRQALALYELARHALLADDVAGAPQALVEVLADSLDHDVAQIWDLRPDGSLRLRAAHPREDGVLEIARPFEHNPLRRALAGDVIRVHDPSLRAWMSRTTRDCIVAPLDGRDGVRGVLLLGRWRDVYGPDDERMAESCAQFIGRALALRPSERLAADEDDSVEESEAELTGS